MFEPFDPEEYDPEAGKLSRHNLKVDRIYHCRDTGAYAVTPDGVGIYWYDSLAEAQDQHGDDEPVIQTNDIKSY